MSSAANSPDESARAASWDSIRPVKARSLLLVSAGVCVVGFVVPWVAITVVQKATPAQPQTVVVPAGARVSVLTSTSGAAAGVVVVTGSGSAVTPTKGGAAPATATTTTRASKPPPPGA